MTKEEWFHIDLGNQIDNSWNKDSALAAKKGEIYFSVKIKSKDKKFLKKKFIMESNSKTNDKHNRNVITTIYCFILFKLLRMSEDVIKKVKLCMDVGPQWAVNKHLSRICRYYNEEPLTNKIRIKFRESKSKKSKAHTIARDVARGRKKETFCLKNKDIYELTLILREINK